MNTELIFSASSFSVHSISLTRFLLLLWSMFVPCQFPLKTIVVGLYIKLSNLKPKVIWKNFEKHLQVMDPWVSRALPLPTRYSYHFIRCVALVIRRAYTQENSPISRRPTKVKLMEWTKMRSNRVGCLHIGLNTPWFTRQLLPPPQNQVVFPMIQYLQNIYIQQHGVQYTQ